MSGNYYWPPPQIERPYDGQEPYRQERLSLTERAGLFLMCFVLGLWGAFFASCLAWVIYRLWQVMA